MDPYFLRELTDKPIDDVPTSSSNEDAEGCPVKKTKPRKRVPRAYVESLEKSIARAHKMLDDKWYDLKQVSK